MKNFAVTPLEINMTLNEEEARLLVHLVGILTGDEVLDEFYNALSDIKQLSPVENPSYEFIFDNNTIEGLEVIKVK